MTDGAPERRRGGSRRAAILIATVSAVAIGAALWITVGGGFGGATAPHSAAVASPSPRVTDLPLVAISPLPAGTPAPTADIGTSSPSGTSSPTPDGGIPADRIRIDRLGIDLTVIEGDGVDAPMGKAAHYPGSAWPDGGSNIYLYGHAQEGMFLALWQARVGDSVELELVDGTLRTYLVTEVLPKVPWNALSYVAPTDSERLTLQTSTSYYSTAPRFIVIAVPET